MVLFDGPLFKVSQGFFSGWRILNKVSGAVLVPNSLQKERIGFVWMQIKRSKRSLSVDANMSEDVIFGSFANAVADPTSPEGVRWTKNSADELADFFIDLGNRYMRGEV